MENYKASRSFSTRGAGLIMCVTFAVAFTAALSPSVHASHPTPPPVPDNIQVPAGNRAFLEGHAFGTQNYICLPQGADVAWTLFGPQATLFNDDAKQVMTHFLSPNLFENGTPRATWHHRDTSTIWALATASSGVADAIPWLLLQVVGAIDGATGGHRLTGTTFIQRLNTVGGLAPSTGCSLLTDVGNRAFVPYSADYFFYKDRKGAADDEEQPSLEALTDSIPSF
jgi:hypothetical protein